MSLNYSSMELPGLFGWRGYTMCWTSQNIGTKTPPTTNYGQNVIAIVFKLTN